MERERQRREKVFLFFYFLKYFLVSFFLCLCIFLLSFSGPICRVTYIDLEKSSQHIAKHCQQQLNVVKALFYIFPFVLLRRFLDGRGDTYEEKEDDDEAEVLVS